LRLPHFSLPYQIRIFPVNSLLISTRNERCFSILAGTAYQLEQQQPNDFLRVQKLKEEAELVS
jgi:hypothetical protein